MPNVFQMPKLRNPGLPDVPLKDDEGNDRPIEDIQADIAAKQNDNSQPKLTDPYADVQSKINDLYNQTGGLTQDIRSHLAAMPQLSDFQPSTGNKIGAIIAATASGALEGPSKGIDTYNKTLTNPYTMAMNQWQQQGQGLGQLSNIYKAQLEGQEGLAKTQAGITEQQQNQSLRQKQLDFEQAQADVKNTQFEQEFEQRAKQFGQENAVKWANANSEKIKAEAEMYRAKNPISLLTPTVLGESMDENGNLQKTMGTREDFLKQNARGPITLNEPSRQNKAAVGSANRVQTQAQYVLDQLNDPQTAAIVGPIAGRIARGEIAMGNSTDPRVMHLYGGIKQLESDMPEHAQKLNDAMVGLDQNPEPLKAALQEIITGQRNIKQSAGVGGNNQSIQPQGSVQDLIAAYKKSKGIQ